MRIDQLGLNSSSIKYTLRYINSNLKKNNKNNQFEKLVDITKKHNLAGCEFPYFRFFNHSDDINKIKNVIKINKIKFCLLDGYKFLNHNEIVKLIPLSKSLNNNFIRIKTSNILSCDRRLVKYKWSTHIKKVSTKLKKLVPILRDNEMKLAIENHQDLDSDDIVNIIDSVGEEYIGLNFDVGNSFATCEFVSEFINKLSKNILNIHLKDYLICPSKKGFYLARCPIGQGNVNIESFFKAIKKSESNPKIFIELGALEAREIKINNNSFWKYFNKNRYKKSKSFFDFINEKKRYNASKNFRTPYEENFNLSKIITYENKQIKDSINYLKKI